mgnify:FL=1
MRTPTAMTADINKSLENITSAVLHKASGKTVAVQADKLGQTGLHMTTILSSDFSNL